MHELELLLVLLEPLQPAPLYPLNVHWFCPQETCKLNFAEIVLSVCGLHTRSCGICACSVFTLHDAWIHT